jgi:hypothetical protein
VGGDVDVDVDDLMMERGRVGDGGTCTHITYLISCDGLVSEANTCTFLTLASHFLQSMHT